MKRILTSFACLALCASVAAAANAPLLSGSQYSEPNQVLATVNAAIQNLNANVPGVLSAAVASVATATGTAEQTLYTYTLPAGALAIGKGLRVKCWGTTGATANNKTRKLYVGTTNTLTTATEAANAQPWVLEMTVFRNASAGQSTVATGLAGTGGVTPLSATLVGTDDMTAAVVVKCTATDATSAAADVTGYGMTVEIIQ